MVVSLKLDHGSILTLERTPDKVAQTFRDFQLDAWNSATNYLSEKSTSSDNQVQEVVR